MRVYKNFSDLYLALRAECNLIVTGRGEEYQVSLDLQQ